MTERISTTVTWRIKNFSFCWQKNERELPGPVFSVEGLQGSKWTLLLFPRASRSKEEGSIACYLHCENEENDSHEIELDLELSALGSDGLPLETVLFTKCKMQGSDWSAPLLLKKKILFLEKRDAFLPKDILTIRCKIWLVNLESINSVRYFATTRIEIEKSSLFGVVKKVDTWLIDKKRYYVEFIPSSEGLPILLNIKTTEEESCYAEIKQANRKVLKFCKCQLFFTKCTGREIAYGLDEFLFQSDLTPLYSIEPIWIIPLTFTDQNTTPYNYISNLYRKMNNLCLHCEIEFSTGMVTENIEKFDYSTNTFENGCRLKEKRPKHLPSLKDDMLSLMTNIDSCDIEIRTVSFAFHAHRIILRARTIFFRKQFHQEHNGEIVYFTDLDNETLYQMLVFIYTDTIENLETKNAMQLYIASEKYGIHSLKHICSSFLQNNMDASICCNALRIADQYQDGNLKKVALSYILEHGDKVIGSDKWQDLERFTELAQEVLYLKRMKN